VAGLLIGLLLPEEKINVEEDEKDSGEALGEAFQPRSQRHEAENPANNGYQQKNYLFHSQNARARAADSLPPDKIAENPRVQLFFWSTRLPPPAVFARKTGWFFIRRGI
jgi:hypothetical protein